MDSLCHKLITLSKNKHGQLLHCKACQMTQLYFNNFYLEFTERDFRAFKRYISEIDIQFWESCPNRASLKRKIAIPTMQHNLVLIFCQQELQSLKDIVFENTTGPDRPIAVSEIDYTQILN